MVPWILVEHMLANREKIALAPYNIRSLRFAEDEAMVGECWEPGGSAKAECVRAIRWGGFNSRRVEVRG
jgi:hypothetical protein